MRHCHIRSRSEEVSDVCDRRLADRCEIQVAYAIGVAKPLSINIDTYGTGKAPEAELQKIIEHSGIFDFRPAAIIDQLSLLKPQGWCYQDTASYGHFGRDEPEFTWEKVNKADEIRTLAGL